MITNRREDDKTHPLALPVGITLDRYIMQRQSAFAYATGELSQLLRDVALAGKIIHREVNPSVAHPPSRISCRVAMSRWRPVIFFTVRRPRNLLEHLR